MIPGARIFRRLLGLLLIGAGVVHLKYRPFLDDIVPERLEDHRDQIARLAAFILIGAGLAMFWRPLRWLARYAAIMILIVTLSAQIKALMHAQRLSEFGIDEPGNSTMGISTVIPVDQTPVVNPQRPIPCSGGANKQL